MEQIVYLILRYFHFKVQPHNLHDGDHKDIEDATEGDDEEDGTRGCQPGQVVRWRMTRVKVDMVCLLLLWTNIMLMQSTSSSSGVEMTTWDLLGLPGP